MSLISIRVQGTCHKRAWEGLQPPQGSPLSQTFLRNLQRRHARSFRISCACWRCSGLNGPRRFPTFFSDFSLPLDVFVDDFLAMVLGVTPIGLIGLVRRLDLGESAPEEMGEADDEADVDGAVWREMTMDGPAIGGRGLSTRGL